MLFEINRSERGEDGDGDAEKTKKKKNKKVIFFRFVCR